MLRPYLADELASHESAIPLALLYWAGLGVSFVLSLALGRHPPVYSLWGGMALVPLLNNSIKRLRLLPEVVEIDCVRAGLWHKTRRFPLRTTMISWKRIASFRGGTHLFLVLQGQSSLQVGAIDGFDVYELEQFYHLLRQAQQAAEASALPKPT